MLVVVDGKKWQAECDACGTWSKEQMGDYRIKTTPGGKEYWQVGSMAVLDEVPAILASLLPVFLLDEPEPTPETWARRIKALDEERAMRKAQKGRTVNGNASAA